MKHDKYTYDDANVDGVYAQSYDGDPKVVTCAMLVVVNECP